MWDLAILSVKNNKIRIRVRIMWGLAILHVKNIKIKLELE
jgi:hypothetical protein